MGLELRNWDTYPRALLLGLWRVRLADKEVTSGMAAGQMTQIRGNTDEVRDGRRTTGRDGAGLGVRRVVKGFLWTLLLTLSLLSTVEGCGPGRGPGRRRAPRKLTPLVYKQHVPNVQENALSASGLNEGKILRGDSQRFKELVPNYNTDISFRDDEGTGADRLMTQRLKEKLNTLAISVMNQWPGVKLRVIEGWDEENIHAPFSLHYEGRALDLTTTDKDKSKYGMLARLAVEAGFDWVYYESRAHIHVSVKSDAFQTGRSGGCFSANSSVETRRGRRLISSLRPGDEVMTLDPSGQAIFSPILLFLDRNRTEIREFYRVTTRSTNLTLTPSHLLYVIPAGFLPSTPLSISDLFTLATPTFARRLEEGDWVLVHGVNGTSLRPERVLRVDSDMMEGVFAPLTATGTILVDGVLSSCYALIDSQSLAHWSFLPVRLLAGLRSGMDRIWKQVRLLVTLVTAERSERGEAILRSLSARDGVMPAPAPTEEQGIHWYAALLYTLTNHLLPAHWLYES